MVSHLTKVLINLEINKKEVAVLLFSVCTIFLNFAAIIIAAVLSLLAMQSSLYYWISPI